MKNLTDIQCQALLEHHDIKPTPSCSEQMLFAALRDAFNLGLHAEVMKTKVKEKGNG